MKAASTCEKSESHLYYLLNYDSEDVEWPAFSGGADQLMWSGLVGGRKTAKMLNGVRFLLHLLKIVLRKLQRTCASLNLACLQRQKEMAPLFKACVPICLCLLQSLQRVSSDNSMRSCCRPHS